MVLLFDYRQSQPLSFMPITERSATWYYLVLLVKKLTIILRKKLWHKSVSQFMLAMCPFGTNIRILNTFTTLQSLAAWMKKYDLITSSEGLFEPCTSTRAQRSRNPAYNLLAKIYPLVRGCFRPETNGSFSVMLCVLRTQKCASF